MTKADGAWITTAILDTLRTVTAPLHARIQTLERGEDVRGLQTLVEALERRVQELEGPRR